MLEGIQGLKTSHHVAAGLAGERLGIREADVYCNYVVDAEAVSGGTTYGSTEMSDPVMGTCGDGFAFHVKTAVRPGKGTIGLHLMGMRTAIIEMRKSKIRLLSQGGATEVSETSGRSGKRQTTSPKLMEITLMKPRQKVNYWNVTRDMPIGRHVILDVRAEEKAHVEVLVGRVRMGDKP